MLRVEQVVVLPTGKLSISSSSSCWLGVNNSACAGQQERSVLHTDAERTHARVLVGEWTTSALRAEAGVLTSKSLIP